MSAARPVTPADAPYNAAAPPASGSERTVVGELLRPHRRRIGLAVAASVGSTVCLLAGPLAVRTGIDSGINRGDAGKLNAAAAAYLVVALIGWACARIQLGVVATVGEQFLGDLRRRSSAHVLSRPIAFFDRHPAGGLVARLTNDVDALQELVQTGLVTAVTNVLLLLFTFVVLIVLSPTLALTVIVALPVLAMATVRFRRRAARAYGVVRERAGATVAALQENLGGVQVVQAFGRERAAAGRFDEINRSQLAAVRRANGIAARYVAFVDAISTIIVGGVLATGGLLASRGQVTVGTVTAFVLYLNNFWEPVGQLSQLLNTVQSARAGLDRIDRLLAEPDHLTDPIEPRGLQARGTLVVDGVSFRYAPGAPAALTDVTLTVAPGERLAVVGPTGAGKSTLARLLVRLDDPTGGAVHWDGVDLRSAERTELRERLLLVPQEGRLFQGTVADNVRLARPDAPDDEVARALDAVGALTWAERLPDGLATEVDEDGGRLSAGERQLVSLARAALADPGLLVLDEATSNLDPVTELAVDRAVEALAEGRTMVVVAHRLSSAERADRVAVIDGGRLAELGSHAELVAAGGRYARLHAAWVTGDSHNPTLRQPVLAYTDTTKPQVTNHHP